jgi:hypothetical protein
MTISYEWEGDHIPSFAMDLMGFMQASEMKESGTWPGKEEDYKEFSAKKGKMMDEDEDET